jgi:hypothetical protein
MHQDGRRFHDTSISSFFSGWSVLLFFSSGRSDPADVLCIGDFVNLPSLSEVSNVLQNNICTFFVMTVSPLFLTLSSVYNADFPFLG